MNHSVSTKYGVMRLASSHLKTHVSLLSLRVTQGGEMGFFSSLLKHTGYRMALRFASGTAHAGLFHYEVSQREDRGHTLELIQTSGVQEHKLSNEAAI